MATEIGGEIAIDVIDRPSRIIDRNGNFVGAISSRDLARAPAPAGNP